MRQFWMAAIALLAVTGAQAQGTKRDIRGVSIGMDFRQAVMQIVQQGGSCPDTIPIAFCKIEGQTIVLTGNETKAPKVFEITYLMQKFPTKSEQDAFLSKIKSLYGLIPVSSGDYNYRMPDGTLIRLAPDVFQMHSNEVEKQKDIQSFTAPKL